MWLAWPATLPFVFLYGRPAFYVFGAGLISGGVLLGLGPGALSGASWTAGGWLTGAVLLGFAVHAGRAGAAPGSLRCMVGEVGESFRGGVR